MNWFDKYMPAIIFAGLLAIAGMVGYYCGMYRAVTQVKAVLRDDRVILQLHGQMYKHIVASSEF